MTQQHITDQKVTVLLVDDHTIVCEAVSSALHETGDFEVWPVTTINEALDRISTVGPVDVVLLDYHMPGVSGMDGVRSLMEANGKGVVLFSGHVPPSTLQHALDIGVMGLIPKTLPLRSLQHALQLVASGEVYVPIKYLSEQKAQTSGEVQLKPREMSVLLRLCEGLQNKEIGCELGISEVLVKADVKSICRKLGVRNRTEVALKARQDGLC